MTVAFAGRFRWSPFRPEQAICAAANQRPGFTGTVRVGTHPVAPAEAGRAVGVAEFLVAQPGHRGWPGPAALAHQFRPENGQELRTGHTPHIGENTTPKFTKNNMYDGA